jgi:predicted nucleic acid-binding protein
MNVLIDTNVVLDVLLRRQPHCEEAMRIMVLSEKKRINGYVSASAITDIYYITGKTLGSKNKALELLKRLLSTIHIANVTDSIIFEAINLEWNDFEDSIQYVAGKNIFAECIITRNPQDFSESKIKIALPEDFLNTIDPDRL